VDDLVADIYRVIGPPPTAKHALVAAARLSLRKPGRGDGSAAGEGAANGWAVAGAVGGVAGGALGAVAVGLLARKVSRSPGQTAVADAHAALGLRRDMAMAVNHHHLLVFSTDALTRRHPRKLYGRIPLEAVEVVEVAGKALHLRLHGLPTTVAGRPQDIAAVAAAIHAVRDAGVVPAF
jgi:hypothetical protein